jgi:hypothetical protein
MVEIDYEATGYEPSVPVAVVHRHLAQLTRHPPVSTDGPLQQAFVAQPVRPSPLPIALCNSECQRQIPRGARLQKSRLQRQGQLLGEALPGETFHNDGVAVAHQRDSLRGGDDLVRRGQARHGLAGKLHRFLLFAWRHCPGTEPLPRGTFARPYPRAYKSVSQVKALNPVMSLPTRRVWIVSVPSKV